MGSAHRGDSGVRGRVWAQGRPPQQQQRHVQQKVWHTASRGLKIASYAAPRCHFVPLLCVHPVEVHRSPSSDLIFECSQHPHRRLGQDNVLVWKNSFHLHVFRRYLSTWRPLDSFPLSPNTVETEEMTSVLNNRESKISKMMKALYFSLLLTRKLNSIINLLTSLTYCKRTPRNTSDLKRPQVQRIREKNNRGLKSKKSLSTYVK